MKKKILYIIINLAIGLAIPGIISLFVQDGMGQLVMNLLAAAAVMLTLFITQVILLVSYTSGKKTNDDFAYMFTWVYSLAALGFYIWLVVMQFKLQEAMADFQREMHDMGQPAGQGSDINSPFIGKHCLALVPVLLQGFLVYCRKQKSHLQDQSTGLLKQL